MTKPTKFAKYRKARAAEGYEWVTVVLSPDTSKALLRLTKRHGNKTRAINAALKEAKV